MYSVISFVLFYAAVWPSGIQSQKLNPNYTALDVWIWSSDQTSNSNVKPLSNIGVEDPLPEIRFAAGNNAINFCDPYDPPKPDFKRPGRRISEEVCQEYIWNDKLIAEQNRRSAACELERRKAFNFTAKDEADYNYYFIGGRSSKENEFPHMGAVGWKALLADWKFKCGSSVISNKFALTAAHCSKATEDDTDLVDLDPKIVRFGSVNILINKKSAINDVNIVRIISHPTYISPWRDHDIAVIELERSLIFTDSIKPACLWGHLSTSTFGDTGTVTGWGITELGSNKFSSVLQAGDLAIIDLTECNKLLETNHNRYFKGVSQNQICAGNLSGGMDACQGDSGGPMQVKVSLGLTSIYYIIGVTSFGFGCAHVNTPGIYTRVSSYLDWVESVVWP